MNSGIARLAAASAVTAIVIALAIVVDHRYDPTHNRSAKDCEATAVRALPKGAMFDHRVGTGPGDVTYRLPQDPVASVDAITKKLRSRGELRSVSPRSNDPFHAYDDMGIDVKTACDLAHITVRWVSPPGPGATAEIETAARVED